MAVRITRKFSFKTQFLDFDSLTNHPQRKEGRMMKFKSLWLCLFPLFVVILVSCATPTAKTPKVSTPEIEREAHKQRVIVLKSHMETKFKLWDVSFKLTNGATSLCKEKTMFSGFQFITKDFFDGDYRDAAIDLYDLGELPKIIHVIEKSPAHEAGLQVGDEILSIEGKSLPTSPEKVGEFMKSLPDNLVSLQMVVRRNAQRLAIELHRKECCDYGIVLVPSDEVNAWADGRRVSVTKGMMRFVENDLELATIVSHELAHNIRGHVDMTEKHQMAGAFFGLLLDIGAAVVGVNTGGQFTQLGMQAGQMMYSKDMEREADYVGMYILASSGYDFQESPNVFRKWGSSHPGSIETKYASSHPSTPERFIALEKAVEEINGKKAKGLALVPEEKQVTIASKALEKEDSQDFASETELRASKTPQSREDQLAHVMKQVRDGKIQGVRLRSTPRPTWDSDIEEMIAEYNFFVKGKNDQGNFPNDFVDNGDGTVTDRTTRLMWEKEGSSPNLGWRQAKEYVKSLNKKNFLGYSDWRMPTTEELASLLAPRVNDEGLHIASVFSCKQRVCWSSDLGEHNTRAVDFSEGSIPSVIAYSRMMRLHSSYSVRAVRTIQSGETKPGQLPQDLPQIADVGTEVWELEVTGDSTGKLEMVLERAEIENNIHSVSGKLSGLIHDYHGGPLELRCKLKGKIENNMLLADFTGYAAQVEIGNVYVTGTIRGTIIKSKGLGTWNMKHSMGSSVGECTMKRIRGMGLGTDK